MSLVCQLNIAYLRQECHKLNLAFLSYHYRKKHLQVHFNRCSVIMQFAELAAGEQLGRRRTRRKL